MDKKEYTCEFIPVPHTTNVRFNIVNAPGSYVPNHWHSAVEIIYVLEGGLTVMMDSRLIQLHREEGILINSRDVHATKWLHGVRYILLQIPDAFLERYLPDINRIRFTENFLTSETARDCLLQMLKIEETRSDGFVLKFNSLVFELLYCLYKNYSFRISQAATDKHMKNISRLEPVLEYTGEHYAGGISIEKIAGIAGFQPAYFCRFFKKHMGVTYLEYLNEVRLSHIYQDLLSTDEAVHLILERHGFTNYKLFCRMFREHFKDTPGGIRKKRKYGDTAP